MSAAGASRAVCVSGMHRSGTSYVTGALETLGVSLGDPAAMMPPGGDNPAGYHELRAVMELDDELLSHLGGAWDQPPVLDPGWEDDPGLDPFRVRAAEILDEAFGPAEARPALHAWKDPRLSILLPFWRTVTPIATTIVVVRDPVEVAASLAGRKYAVGTTQAASLWLRYLYAAAAADPGHLVVRHDQVFGDTAGTLAAIAAHLGLPTSDAGAVRAAASRLDLSLRHHRDVARPAPGADPLLDLADAVWDGGAVRLDVLPPAAATALARGWLRPPADGELLARARAETMALRETVRRLHRAQTHGTDA